MLPGSALLLKEHLPIFLQEALWPLPMSAGEAAREWGKERYLVCRSCTTEGLLGGTGLKLKILLNEDICHTSF